MLKKLLACTLLLGSLGFGVVEGVSASEVDCHSEKTSEITPYAMGCQCGGYLIESVTKTTPWRFMTDAKCTHYPYGLDVTYIHEEYFTRKCNSCDFVYNGIRKPTKFVCEGHW